MSDRLSVEDIRRWLAIHITTADVKKNPSAQRGRELPTRAFARAVGVDWSDLTAMRAGTKPIGRRAHAALSRFIRDWENGLLEFGTVGKGRQRNTRFLIHRATPKPRGQRARVSWDGGAKLTILPRPAMNPRIPQFRDIFANLTKRVSKD